uniref:Uncharacterized protein n=1 Tax=Panagrolaimus superbus TaxID=310955 RepID=A0A914XWZ3_9BILA
MTNVSTSISQTTISVENVTSISPNSTKEKIVTSNQLFPDPLIPHNDEYLCCCGCFQIYCGTITIALFHYLFLCLSIIFEISSSGRYGFTFLGNIVIGCHSIFYIFIVVLFIGLEQKSTKMLLPYIIYGYILVALYIFAWIFLTIIVLLAQPSYIRRIIGKHDFSVSTIKIILFIKSTFIFLGLALIQVWCNFVVQKCRKYFRLLGESNSNNNSDDRDIEQ